MKGIGGLYGEGRLRLAEIAAGLRADELQRLVPACPRWTVRDLLAHLAGTCTDVLAGRVDGVTTEAWADGQVRARRDRTPAELLEEWSVAAARLEGAPEHLPEPLGTLWVLDLTAHEHDLRGAVGRPGARDAPALLSSTDFLVSKGLHGRLVAMDAGPLVVRTEVATWSVGERAAAGQNGTVSCSLFDLFRALTGRRSPSQIARFDWSVDPSRFVPAFEFETFTTRTTDLEE
jgi:uncharacterized protein (TIGR03083 family)